ncbi:hypothetical protein CTAM01_09983 [Colletotrichum tamarilloi]|uniref:Uncharacterized protein n=1 Tax=Colletotrichum tamarilloi TaxID=1209934 RepID=A0ABQ9R1L2_9PEZI|nr:uncharacterized protein CTAM01_09983 [Colletotrichum tamarilloi]KAK1492189.1 hypothetical protein CTAM01_09983 [Colletotrichum tamarilloi]
MDAGWMGVRSAACGQDGEEEEKEEEEEEKEEEEEEQTKTRLGLESSTSLLRARLDRQTGSPQAPWLQGSS